MGADIVNGVEFPADVAHGNGPVADLVYFGRSGRDFADVTYFFESHSVVFPSVIYRVDVGLVTSPWAALSLLSTRSTRQQCYLWVFGDQGQSGLSVYRTSSGCTLPASISRVLSTRWAMVVESRIS